MDDRPQYATVRSNSARGGTWEQEREREGEGVPTSAVPSIVLSPASPSQPAHSPNPQAAETRAETGKEAVSSSRGGAGGGEALRGGGRARSATTAQRDGEGGEGATTGAPPALGSRSSSTPSSRRPSTAPSPSSAPSPASSASPLPSPAPSSESRTFFASLASSIVPSIPSLPSFNLTSLLPSKLPGAPTLHVNHGGEGRDSFESGESEEGYVGFDEEEGAEEDRERRRKKREEREGQSMDLRIEEATDGASFVRDHPSPSSSSAASTSQRTPTSPSSPPFAQLSRTPSSAAFVAASKEGRVNPLTLHAVARRDSEREALRLVHERKETERRRENSAGEETQGGTALSSPTGGPPRLLRKQSWTAAGQAISRGLGGGTPRSESPPPLSEGEELGTGNGSGRRKKDFAGRGLGLVQEAEDSGARREGSQDTVGPTPPSAASTTATFRSASAVTPHPATPTNANGKSASTATVQPPTASSTAAAPSGTTTTKRRSLFSRFTRSGRSVSQSSASTIIPPSPGMSSTRTASVSSPRVSEFGAQLDSPVPVPVERVDTKRSEKGKEREGVRVAKVKAKGKSTKDFGRLFLAQELFIPPASSSSSSASPSSTSPPSSSFRPATANTDNGGGVDPPAAPDTASQHSHAAAEEAGAGAAKEAGGKKKGAVWAIKFSDDGRYLAVGGKDGVVRVWEVLSSPSAREAALHPHQTTTTSASPADSPNLASSAFDSPPLSRSSMPTFTTPTSSTPKKGSAKEEKERLKEEKAKDRVPVSVLPVFASKPVREFKGHEADVLDLSWSKNNFLLSSSMDKTVRLWHVSRSECLCAFQHLDFVTSIAFHPKDDRFFLSGSLDCKLRLWNIPEKRVHIWTELPELITSVAFTRDGQLAIAGSFVGICMFFEVSTFRYHSTLTAKSSRGKNAKGKKVTAMCPFPLPNSMGERLLVTTNDSRIRLYHTGDKVVETKYAGHENTSSQIRATFSDDGRYIITGSEDQNVYIFSSGICEQPEKGKGAFGLNKKHKEGGGYECFPMSAHIVTAALFAPTPTRQLLASANDPIFADGHTHTAPLSLAQTVSSVASSCTTDGSAGERLVPARTREGGGVRLGGAEDAIIVVADDETGIISIFRNSTLPSDPSVLGYPVGVSAASSAIAAVDSGFHDGNGGMTRSGSIKRWSKGGR